MLSDEAFAELRVEWNQALPAIIAGEPDRTDLMRSIDRARGRLLSIRDIMFAVSYASGVEVAAMTGESLAQKVSKARTLVVCLASELRPDLSRVHVAGWLNKERSIVYIALKRAEALKCNDNDFVHWYRGARRRLGL